MTGTPEKTLGHRFANPRLLETALTHASLAAARASNERLEFLGDRVLGLLLAELLFARFPAEPEGSLAKRHAVLAGKPALAQIAKDTGLDTHIKLSPAEEKSGGGAKEAILADALEAVIAAIYLDGGLDAARGFVEKKWAAMLTAQNLPPEDPKSALQEWAQARKLPLPVYTAGEKSGTDHNPVFEVEVTVSGIGMGVGVGPSKRAAEKAAAEKLLEKILREKV